MSITPTELSAAADISLSYASMVLSGKRKTSNKIAAKAFRETGVKIGPLAPLSDAAAVEMANGILGEPQC